MIPQDNSDVTTADIFKMLTGEITPSDIHRRREEAEQERLQYLVRDEIMKFYEPLNTSHLLKEYRDIRRRGEFIHFDIECGTQFSYDLPPRNFPLERLVVKNGVAKEFRSAHGITPFLATVMDALKTTLNSREHIPRGKKARQLRAKQRKGQGKSKNR